MYVTTELRVNVFFFNVYIIYNIISSLIVFCVLIIFDMQIIPNSAAPLNRESEVMIF